MLQVKLTVDFSKSQKQKQSTNSYRQKQHTDCVVTIQCAKTRKNAQKPKKSEKIYFFLQEDSRKVQKLNFEFVEPASKSKKREIELPLQEVVGWKDFKITAYKTIAEILETEDGVDGWFHIGDIAQKIQASEAFTGSYWRLHFTPKRLVRTLIRLGILDERAGNVKLIKRQGVVLRCVRLSRDLIQSYLSNQAEGGHCQ